MDNIQANLTCPITMDILDDPVGLPCCGVVVGRQALKTWSQTHNDCPLCRGDLTHVNVEALPKSINIASMIEDYHRTQIAPNDIQQLFESTKLDPRLEWRITINKLQDSAYKTVIGYTQICNSNAKPNFKTLLVPVIDESGSMYGNPTFQVKYSLNRIIDATFDNSHIITHVISYNDRARSFAINKTLSQHSYTTQVNAIGRGGGTSFRAAFTELANVCDIYKHDISISNIVVIFLTDGQDYCGDRAILVNELQQTMTTRCNKPFTVHTVGFGNGHDFDFLNNLRLIGTTEGAYRFADPSENNDSLSAKIASLLDVIVKSNTVPVKITKLPANVRIFACDGNTYWLDLTKCDHTHDMEFTICINNTEYVDLQSKYDYEADIAPYWEKWYNYLVDTIATELISLNNNNNQGASISTQFHLELLTQRCKAILCRLSSDSANILRLNSLLTTISTLKAGGCVDRNKLNDIKFEGKFATKSSNNVLQPQITNITYTANAYVPANPNAWTTYPRPTFKRCDSSASSSEIFRVIGAYNNVDAIKWFSNNLIHNKDVVDSNDSNALIVASSLGRYGLVQNLLDSNMFDLDCKNKYGYNAVDLAILFGYWKTYDMLVACGAKCSLDGNSLLRTCLGKNHIELATRLIKSKTCTVTQDLMNLAPNSQIMMWLSKYLDLNIDIETAIRKGVLDIVHQKIDTIHTFSWQSCHEIFAKATNDHIQIIDLLLSTRKADVDQIINITTTNKQFETETEITWPLFVACEKGQIELFNVLIKYIDVATIDRQNNKGTTCLWIACCNNHIDIVNQLLSMGANPNISNFKGDSALIPACQKGLVNVVQLLIDSQVGIDLTIYNKNRDNAVLICCRTNQSKILNLLLQTLTKTDCDEILKSCADIDGFNPLLAATELNHVQCIQVCLKYGANIEYTTSDDNAIISGATALHLACFYNKLESVKTLVENGANILATTRTKGYTPLHIAIRQGSADVARYLLTNGVARQALKMVDFEFRLPSYYVTVEGNTDIYNEFFANNLVHLFQKIVVGDNVIVDDCVNILREYGTAPGVYEYADINAIDMGNGSDLLSTALVTNNNQLINFLRETDIDIHKPDDYGVTASFWMCLLGCQSNDNQFDEKTLRMVEAIHASSELNSQNKFLLSMRMEKPLSLTETATMTITDKLSNGYNIKISDKTIQNLKSSNNLQHSLLGFLDKLQNNRVFPDGKQCLANILWDSKIHLIKLMTNNNTKLQPLHIMSIYLYTANKTIFTQVNNTLALTNDKSIWTTYIYCLYQSLTLLPEFVGEVYRPVDFKFNVQYFTIGNEITWSTFSICSSEYRNANDLINSGKGMIFVIQSKTARLISKYSKTPADSEVIFLPGTKFRVINHYVASIIALAQANIRASTYRALEKDLQKAECGKSSIIIELQEI